MFNDGERRLGRRLAVRVPVKLTNPPKRPKVLPRRGVDAVVVDVSVTGLAIEASDAKRLQRGVVVRVSTEEVEGDVVVRHVVHEGGTAHLGVQLLDSHSPFAEWAYRLVQSADRRDPPTNPRRRGAL